MFQESFVSVDIQDGTAADREWVSSAVRELLRESTGDPARELVNFAQVYSEILDPRIGGVFVAWRDSQEIGVITYTRRPSLRLGGIYYLIEDLWVSPQARRAGAGSGLIAAVADRARRNGISILEVGLPMEPEFDDNSLRRGSGNVQPNLPSLPTETFYRRAGFTPLGPRFRCAVAGVVRPPHGKS